MGKSISILGSTGSIGRQALDVAEHLQYDVKALAAYSNIEILEEQVRKFKPDLVCVYNPDAAKLMKVAISDLDTDVLTGMDGLCEAAAYDKSDILLNSVVGMIGLQPTLEGIKSGKIIALANKETLVAGGKLVYDALASSKAEIVPVDSEHSAVFQCLQACNDKSQINRIILTASGGPFFGMERDDLKHVTVEQALNHPNWSMGNKITIDSATMMNKGLEIIEAAWLFNQPIEKIDVIVHRESIIHSLVEFTDYSVLAQLGNPDMRIPIQYALTYPDRMPSPVKQLSLADVATMTFFEPDPVFICLEACKKAFKRGGTYPAIVNGANEQAVALFLNKKIGFLEIGELIMRSLEEVKGCSQINSVDDVLDADRMAREFVRNSVC